VRFGRKSGSKDSEEAAFEVADESSQATEATGPFDASEVDLDERDFIDLGSLLIAPVGPLELQLQVDEASGQVMAVMLIGEEGALELRAFAASRGSGAWDELRPRISAEMAQMGGTSDEKQGSFGTELLCMVPMQAPDGKATTQPSRIVAHEGPAWLLRATLIGPPAVEPDLAAPWEETIRQVVVRRGREAMPPGVPLPISLPPDARRLDSPAGD
jgi:hypothetical protein